MNVYLIFTQLCKTILYTFTELHLKCLLMYLLYYLITIVTLLHGIYITIK